MTTPGWITLVRSVDNRLLPLKCCDQYDQVGYHSQRRGGDILVLLDVLQLFLKMSETSSINGHVTVFNVTTTGIRLASLSPMTLPTNMICHTNSPDRPDHSLLGNMRAD